MSIETEGTKEYLHCLAQIIIKKSAPNLLDKLINFWPQQVARVLIT